MKLKEEDKVKVVTLVSVVTTRFDKIGTIVYIDASKEFPYYVKFPDGGRIAFCAKELRLVKRGQVIKLTKTEVIKAALYIWHLAYDAEMIDLYKRPPPNAEELAREAGLLNGK